MHEALTGAGLPVPVIPRNKLSRRTTKPTKWHVRPAKTQLSLGIHPVWSESSLSHEETMDHWIPTERKQIPWSDWVDAQAGLHLCRVILLVLSCSGSIAKCYPVAQKSNPSFPMFTVPLNHRCAPVPPTFRPLIPGSPWNKCLCSPIP